MKCKSIFPLTTLFLLATSIVVNAQLKDEAGKLILDIQDQRSQKMANISIDPTMMLDVQLTQRMLLNVPSYDGKAGLDTFVISSRQPLIQGGF